MKIELKSLQYSAFASQETNCYSANLYVDDRKIGEVGNDGHGGCDSFHGDQASYKATDAWCRANLPQWKGFDGEPLDTDLELHCGRLIEDWMAARDMKAALRTKVLFTKPSDGKLYEVRHRGQMEATIASIASAHPGAAILNGKPLDEALALYRAEATP